jgi:calcineurin-like phosphoesterase family protein
MKTTWFRGCVHHGHANIIRLCNRPFGTIEEADRTILSNHNALVSESDIVYDLGDIAYKCSPEHVVKCIEKTKGNIKILLGNHDKPFRTAFKMGLLDSFIHSGKLEIIGPVEHDMAVIKTIQINGQKIVLCHYSLRTWNGAFRDAIHLFSHSHGNLPPHFKSRDIGVDTTGFCPISFEQIMDEMSQIHIEFSEK